MLSVRTASSGRTRTGRRISPAASRSTCRRARSTIAKAVWSSGTASPRRPGRSASPPPFSTARAAPSCAGSADLVRLDAAGRKRWLQMAAPGRFAAIDVRGSRRWIDGRASARRTGWCAWEGSRAPGLAIGGDRKRWLMQADPGTCCTCRTRTGCGCRGRPSTWTLDPHPAGGGAGGGPLISTDVRQLVDLAISQQLSEAVRPPTPVWPALRRS